MKNIHFHNINIQKYDIDENSGANKNMNFYKEFLISMGDKEYKKFSSSLIPNINNILGVRLPMLRKLAKEISKNDWKAFIKNCDNEYFEEVMLQGMVIGYIKVDVKETLHYISEFIPKIDNWSICDSFCISLKFTKDNMSEVWRFIQKFLVSDEEYEIRFGVVMIIDYFINEIYIDEILNLLDKIKHSGYYVKMAVAWAISICYTKFPEKTMTYLKNNNLDEFTFNKSLQKILDSLQVDKSDKVVIKNMKRK